MKGRIRLMLVAAVLAASCGYGFAGGQAPAGAPAGATGQCKDGIYSTAAARPAACRGHQGVKDWYAASAAPAVGKPASMPPPAVAVGSTTVPAAVSPQPPAMPSPTPVAAPLIVKQTTAAGGGPGMVWMNTGTKVYHCPGSQFYGKTKEGKYMSEADAKAAGGRPNHNKACTK